MNILPNSPTIDRSDSMLAIKDYQSLIKEYQKLSQDSRLMAEKEALSHRIVECAMKIQELRQR